MTFEVCVDTLAGLHAACEGGADRIELCSALSEGGLTPSAGLMQAASRLPVPTRVMIRPRGGDFCFSEAEQETMLADIAMARSYGLAGVVLGCLTERGLLNHQFLQQQIDAADGLAKTLHRAIDLAATPIDVVDQAIDLGFDSILTSGAAHSAEAGAGRIAEMVARADGRIEIIAGAGLTLSNVAGIVRRTRAPAYHASCRTRLPNTPDALGFTPADGRYETSEDTVRQMRARIGEALR